jgi:hypothetical protein
MGHFQHKVEQHTTVSSGLQSASAVAGPAGAAAATPKAQACNRSPGRNANSLQPTRRQCNAWSPLREIVRREEFVVIEIFMQCIIWLSLVVSGKQKMGSIYG